VKVSFVIPFHNEEKNAGPMLEQVLKYALKQRHWQFEIIPVNDRSHDDTKKTLDLYAKKYKQIKPFHRNQDSQELGNTMGKALLEGSKRATGDIIIWTMGDRADDPETYGKIVEKIQASYDLVFGSRYMQGGTWGSLDPTKAFLSSRGTVLAKLLFGIKVNDITNAFRGFRKELLRDIKLESPGYAISPEFAIKAHLAGFKLTEVPTIYYKRVEGVSNFKLWNMSIAYLKIYFSLFIEKWFGDSSSKHTKV
jgi:glycosyltransferase involved in cell wall biosynthesis